MQRDEDRFIGASSDIDARNTEREQATIRVVIIAVGVSYMTYSIETNRIPESYQWAIAVLACAISLASILILAAVIRWPGIHNKRRMVGMAHDYTALTVALTFGGVTLMPLYSLLLWVTIGNGFRYGPRYHLAATTLALLTLIIVVSFNPYWQEQPYTVVTLCLTTLIVPAYAHRLLSGLHRARDAALNASIAKSRFLAQASHDLRQPIHAISLFTACLRDTSLCAEQRQMVASIDKSLNSVTGLFRSLLDLSTIESGRVAVNPKTVALGDILKDVVRQNSEIAQWADVTFRLIPTRHHVQIDPALLNTILQNIVSNALKYAPGRPVLIGCRRRSDTLRIQIYDCGPGIAEHHLPRLFDEFYRVRSPGDRDIEGVGLGMSIVKRLAMLMGLTVTIRSAVGKGTMVEISSFRIVIPSQPDAGGRRSSTSTALDGFNVLLVEDDSVVLEATATLLDKWGCHVQKEIAIPARSRTDYDLIVTDFDLGERVTGIDCILEIRKRAGRNIPAIVMTGHDPDSVREHIRDAGISILSKPIRPAELRSVLVAQKFKAMRVANQTIP